MNNVNTVIDSVNETVDKATKATNQTINKASKATQQVADTIGEKGEQLRTVEKRLMKETKAYVRDNPITSIGIAIGVGFVLSKLFSDR